MIICSTSCKSNNRPRIVIFFPSKYLEYRKMPPRVERTKPNKLTHQQLRISLLMLPSLFSAWNKQKQEEEVAKTYLQDVEEADDLKKGGGFIPCLQCVFLATSNYFVGVYLGDEIPVSSYDDLDLSLVYDTIVLCRQVIQFLLHSIVLIHICQGVDVFHKPWDDFD